MSSSEEELTHIYQNWNSGRLTWAKFGNFNQNDIDRLKVQWFPNDAVSGGLLQDIWFRHPNRHGNHFP